MRKARSREQMDADVRFLWNGFAQQVKYDLLPVSSQRGVVLSFCAGLVGGATLAGDEHLAKVIEAFFDELHREVRR